jgi:uncharacterized OsmC-like protein
MDHVPTGTLNGFDLDVIGTLQGCIRADPERARPRYSASVRWLGGQRSESTVGGGARLAADEPVECSGTGSAPTPEDYLLSAVGSCLTAAWVGALTTRGIAIRDLAVDVSGRVNFAGAYLLDGTPSGFGSIDIEVRLDADADPELLEELGPEVLRMSIIPDTIARPVPFSMRLAPWAGAPQVEA